MNLRKKSIIFEMINQLNTLVILVKTPNDWRDTASLITRCSLSD